MLDVLLNWNQNLVDFFTHSIIMVIAFTWVTAVAIYHYSNTEKVPFFKGNLLSFLHGFKAVGSYFLGLMLLLNFWCLFLLPRSDYSGLFLDLEISCGTHYGRWRYVELLYLPLLN